MAPETYPCWSDANRRHEIIMCPDGKPEPHPRSMTGYRCSECQGWCSAPAGLPDLRQAGKPTWPGFALGALFSALAWALVYVAAKGLGWL